MADIVARFRIHDEASSALVTCEVFKDLAVTITAPRIETDEFGPLDLRRYLNRRYHDGKRRCVAELALWISQGVRLFVGRFGRWWEEGEVTAERSLPAPAVFYPSERLLLSDSADARTGRLLLAARGIRHGYREFMSCADGKDDRRCRMAAVAMALAHEPPHSVTTVTGNPAFQGPFVTSTMPGR